MPIDAHARRRQEDLAKLQEMERHFRGVISIRRTRGNPVSSLELEITVPTARSRNYPEEKQPNSIVGIELPARYPFDPPKVTVTTPVWNPNIYVSGLVCLGQKWIPTQNLALLVEKLIQILTLDPTIINLQSPANGDAAAWYGSKRRSTPSLFPTATLDSLRAAAARKIVWKNIK